MNSAPKPRPTIAIRILLSGMRESLASESGLSHLFLALVGPHPHSLAPSRMRARARCCCARPSSQHRRLSVPPTSSPALRLHDIEHAVHDSPVRRERADVRILSGFCRGLELEGRGL